MPGTPGLGEGMIRTHDLLQTLRADIDAAYATLENDRESQYLRRCVVRAVFSYIEAIVESIKVELRSAIRAELYAKKHDDSAEITELTDNEKETLGPLHVVGAVESGKFLPLDTNIKRTFRLAAKIWRLQGFTLSTGGQDFQDFLAAKSARNRLTHPRRYYDVEVTDHDMHCHTIAGMWLQAEFQRLIHARILGLTADMSVEERDALSRSAEPNRSHSPGTESS